MWGAGLLVDAVLRVLMSYTLPVSVVPGLGGALWPVTFIVLQVVTNVYYHRAGLYRMLGASWISRGSDDLIKNGSRGHGHQPGCFRLSQPRPLTGWRRCGWMPG